MPNATSASSTVATIPGFLVIESKIGSRLEAATAGHSSGREGCAQRPSTRCRHRMACPQAGRSGCQMGHDWQVLNPLDVIRRYTEDVWNGADPDAMATFVADPCLRHEAGHLDTMDLATNRARLVETLARFPELAIVNRELLADGERVASCYELSWSEDGAAPRDLRHRGVPGAERQDLRDLERHARRRSLGMTGTEPPAALPHAACDARRGAPHRRGRHRPRDREPGPRQRAELRVHRRDGARSTTATAPPARAM